MHRTLPVESDSMDCVCKKEFPYVCRVIAKSLQPTLLKIALTDRHGENYAESETTLDNVEFVEIEVVLQTYADDCDADLRITFNQYGTITIGTVSLMPQYNFHGMRSDVVDLMKEMGIRILRWPGGNFAGDYYWKDGLLPVDMRSPLESHWRLDTQPHTNGYDYHEINTDDFIALCRKIGAEPFITLNPTWNTAQGRRTMGGIL